MLQLGVDPGQFHPKRDPVLFLQRITTLIALGQLFANCVFNYPAVSSSNKQVDCLENNNWLMATIFVHVGAIQDRLLDVCDTSIRTVNITMKNYVQF